MIGRIDNQAVNVCDATVDRVPECADDLAVLHVQEPVQSRRNEVVLGFVESGDTVVADQGRFDEVGGALYTDQVGGDIPHIVWCEFGCGHPSIFAAKPRPGRTLERIGPVAAELNREG
ncbi:hypothetical protein ACFVWR_03610 [Leifsonia sp. NPDC058292]|uniref:hypothetical protein n=1 Tax=Leifsonia sp. NPDC058292 TaxID=3346428 RepID=UPI0036D8662F